MVMPSKCQFCDKIYGDAEEHKCTVANVDEAVQILAKFIENIMTSDGITRKLIEIEEEPCINGESVRSKDDN